MALCVTGRTWILRACLSRASMSVSVDPPSAALRFTPGADTAHEKSRTAFTFLGFRCPSLSHCFAAAVPEPSVPMACGCLDCSRASASASDVTVSPDTISAAM